MPNGQMVEFYAPLEELEAAKKDGNHDLFDKWRDAPVSERAGKNLAEFEADLETSYNKYQGSGISAIGRLGLSSSAAAASWENVAVSLESVTRKKLSLRSSAEKAPLPQEPSSRTIPTGKSSDNTITRDLSSVAETKSDIKPPPENNNITPEEKKAKDKPAPVRVLFRITLAKQHEQPEALPGLYK